MSYTQDLEQSPQPGSQREPEIQRDIRPDSSLRPGLFQRVDFSDDVIGFRGGSQKRTGVKLALWTWLSAAVDTLIIISMGCFFMLAFSILMKTSGLQIMKVITQDLSLLKLFMASMGMSFWIYLIFMRVFNGATFGEWTCNLRLGQPSQRIQKGYLWKVLIRTSLIMITGIITIPLLSLALKRDLAGEISGLKIYSLY